MDARVLTVNEKGGLGTGARWIGERLRLAGVEHINDLEDMSNAFAHTAAGERFRVNDELV